MEHVLAVHIREYLDRNKYFADEQHGFRAKRSCESQLIITLHHIAKLTDEGVAVDAIILDFSKAFDTVSHPKLLSKLKASGISSQIITWIQCWLTQRTQSVQIQGQTSDPALVTSGVPQGSVLGPLLFIIYINDITACVSTRNSLRLFADDALLFGPQGQTLQNDLECLANWSQDWQMTFNANKCKVISFAKSNSTNEHMYLLGNDKLERVRAIKYLGVWLTSDLDWSEQVNQVSNKTMRILGMLRRSMRRGTIAAKLTMYKTLIRPVLEYASCSWSPYRTTQQNQLERAQRKAIRWATGLKPRDSVTQVMQQYSVKTLATRRTERDLTTLVHMLEGRVDINPEKLITRNRHHNTRHNILHFPANTNVYANSFFPRAVRSLNTK
jgi:hypothetical protein